MPLEYHPVDDNEYNRLTQRRQNFYTENQRDGERLGERLELNQCGQYSSFLLQCGSTRLVEILFQDMGFIMIYMDL